MMERISSMLYSKNSVIFLEYTGLLFTTSSMVERCNQNIFSNFPLFFIKTSAKLRFEINYFFYCLYFVALAMIQLAKIRFRCLSVMIPAFFFHDTSSFLFRYSDTSFSSWMSRLWMPCRSPDIFWRRSQFFS